MDPQTVGHFYTPIQVASICCLKHVHVYQVIGRPTPVNESFSQLPPLVYLPQWCFEIIFYTSPGVKIEGKVFVHNRESMRHFKIDCVPAQLFFGGVYCQQTTDLRAHVSERDNCLRTRWKPRTQMYSRSWTTSPNLCNRKTIFFSRIVRSLSQWRHLMTQKQMIPQLIYKETRKITQEQMIPQLKWFKFCVFATDMFVTYTTYLILKSQHRSWPSAALPSIVTL